MAMAIAMAICHGKKKYFVFIFPHISNDASIYFQILLYAMAPRQVATAQRQFVTAPWQWQLPWQFVMAKKNILFSFSLIYLMMPLFIFKFCYMPWRHGKLPRHNGNLSRRHGNGNCHGNLSWQKKIFCFHFPSYI